MQFLPIQKPLIGWNLQNVEEYGPWKSIIVLINPTKTEEVVNLPVGEWCVLANNKVSGIDPINQVMNNKIKLAAISMYVLIEA